MSASTDFGKVEKMLKECAPGSTIRLANHSRVIHFGGKVYRTFPKADPVENGHIRKMVRFFGLTSCASKRLPEVIKEKQDEAESVALGPQPSVHIKAPKKR